MEAGRRRWEKSQRLIPPNVLCPATACELLRVTETAGDIRHVKVMTMPELLDSTSLSSKAPHSGEPALPPAVAAIRAVAMEGLSSLPNFAAGVGLCQRTIWAYIAQGMPAVYIGRAPYPVVREAISWIRDRRRRSLQPRPVGRPRKQRIAA
jgi:hypothetical protein